MITERSARPAGAGDCVPAPWRIGAPRGRLFTIEGVWGAGKTTAARLVAGRLAQTGFTVTVLHYGPEPGSAGHLSQFLETAPLRSRTGLGGYAVPHHAAVDVLLHLCREAHHQLTCFQPALAAHDAVIVDRGVYSKLAWSLTVLAETSPGTDPAVLLGRLQAAVDPWFCHPGKAVFLDTPWPLARERAITRGHGGGDPAAIERLVFLPRYLDAYRQVLDAYPGRVTRIRTGLRGPDDIAEEITGLLAGHLDTSRPVPVVEGN
jgi:dTMP kinase